MKYIQYRRKTNIDRDEIIRIYHKCEHTGKCMRRFGGIYAYCRYFIDRKWYILVLINLCKHLGIDSSTDHPDRYSNLFLNAYINCHVYAEYLKMI